MGIRAKDLLLEVGCFIGIRTVLFILLAVIPGLVELPGVCFSSSVALPDSAILCY